MVRHLSAPELVRLADPAPADAAARAHLAACDVCRARLDALREEESALAAALVELDETPESPAEAARLDALADRMMDRLRLDVGAPAAAPVAIPAAAPRLAVVDGDGPRAARPRRAALWWGGAGLAALAAGLAFLLTRAPDERPRSAAGPASPATPPAGPVAVGTPPGTTPAPGPATPSPTTGVPRPAPGVTPAAPAAPTPRVAAGTPPAVDTVAMGEEEVTRSGALLRSLEDQLGRLLARYAAALEARDTAAVRALYPAASDDALRGPPVGATRRLTLQPRTLRRITPDSAEAIVRVLDEGTPGPARDVAFAFRRGPERWVIARGGRP